MNWFFYVEGCKEALIEYSWAKMNFNQCQNRSINQIVYVYMYWTHIKNKPTDSGVLGSNAYRDGMLLSAKREKRKHTLYTRLSTRARVNYATFFFGSPNAQTTLISLNTLRVHWVLFFSACAQKLRTGIMTCGLSLLSRSTLITRTKTLRERNYVHFIVRFFSFSFVR